MKPDESKKALLKSLGLKTARLKSVELETAIEAMFAFYKEKRAQGCKLDEDGDMLLFQWGTYDGDDEEHFIVDVTRQFIQHVRDDQIMSQLSLRYSFSPNKETRKLNDGNVWCYAPSKLPAFRKLVTRHQAVLRTKGVPPLKASLSLGRI